jgi:hypothetical protein
MAQGADGEKKTPCKGAPPHSLPFLSGLVIAKLPLPPPLLGEECGCEDSGPLPPSLAGFGDSGLWAGDAPPHATALLPWQ